MKRLILFFCMSLFLTASISFPQPYVKLGGGYNLSFNSTTFGTSTTGGSSGNYNYEIVSGSLGEGVNFAGGFGYNFSSNVGLELNVIYKLTKEFEEKDTYESTTSTSTINGSFFGFVPTFVITAPLKSVKPFAKIGLLVAIPSAEIKDVASDGDTRKSKVSSNVDFGLTGGAGILVPISNNVEFFTEVDIISFTWKPSELEQTDYDGTTRTIKFEDEFSSNDEYTTASVFIPFSNVGLNIGVRIGF